jgi:hypothetical protein
MTRQLRLQPRHTPQFGRPQPRGPTTARHRPQQISPHAQPPWWTPTATRRRRNRTALTRGVGAFCLVALALGIVMIMLLGA